MRINRYVGTEKAPSRIISALVNDTSEIGNEFWKALYYDETDCLDKPNVSIKDRRKVIYKRGNLNNFNGYKIFNFPLLTDSIMDDGEENLIQLRIYQRSILPIDTTKAVISYRIDVYTSSKLASFLDKDGDLVERTEFLVSHLLDMLVNLEIGLGFDLIQFNRELERTCRSEQLINNGKLFYARSMTIAMLYQNLIGDNCEQ
jgi:hypothetical protein